MKLDNIENKKSFSIYHFDELKKMKFDKFQIYLGSERPPYYFCKGEEYYPKLVQKDDYEKFGLIVKKKINVKKILKYSDWENIEELIENKENTEEFYHELYKNVRLFIEDDLYHKDGNFTLGDFQFTYIVDDVEIKLKESRSKRRNRILVNSLNYLFWIYIVSVIILCFVDLKIGLIVLFFPGLVYFYWGLHKIFKEMRDGKNIFRFYLIDVPIFFIFKTILLGWYFIPFYFIYKSPLYYHLMEIIGGIVGETIWGLIYIFIMTFIGSKLLDYLDSVEKKIKSYF